MTVNDPSLSSSGRRRSALANALTPWDVSRARITKLQTLCREQDLGGLLFIPGVDGRSNWGSQTFLNWALLGKTGRALAGEPYIESEYDALEDSVILVTPQGFSIFYNHEVSGVLEPVLAHLLGVVEYRTTQAELDDSDLFEHRKIQAFLHMLDNAIEPGQRRIGIPFPLGFDDARDLESWPLIAAFALDELGCRGFFSARYEVTDVRASLQALVADVDSAFIDTVAAMGMHTLRHHVRSTLSVAEGPEQSWSSRSCLSEAELCEPLQTLHEFGHVRDSPSARAAGELQAPRVLLGPRTALLPDPSTRSCSKSLVEGAFHMVMEGGDPASGLRFCRTYFLRCNTLPSHALRQASLLPGQAPPTAEEGTVNSSHAHAARFHGAYSRLVEALSCLPALSLPPRDLSSMLQARLSDGPWEELHVCVEAADAAGSVLDPCAPKLCACLVYVRLTACLGHEGAVAVGDTLLYRPQAHEGSTYTPLTHAHCPPAFTAWAGPGAEDFYATRIARSLLDGHLAAEMGLGQPVGPLFNHVTALLPSSAYPSMQCQLRLFESGLALLRTSRFPLIIPFHHGIEDIRLCEPSSSVPTPLLQLRLKEPLCGALPFAPPDAQPLALALVLPSPGSSLSHTLLPLLQSWRVLVEQQGGGATSLLHDGTPLLPSLEAALVAYSAQQPSPSPTTALPQDMFTQELADALADLQHKQGPPQPQAENEGRSEAVSVTVLLGLPGSGVLEVGRQLWGLASAEQGWAYVPVALPGPLPPCPSTPTAAPSALLAPVTAALTQALQSRPKRLLLAVVSDCVSLPALCLHLLRQSFGGGLRLRIAGASGVMSLARLSVPLAKPSEAPISWPSGLWDQASEGWCTSLLLLHADSGSSNNTDHEAAALLAQSVRRRFRLCNAHAPVLQVVHGVIEAGVLHELLRPDSFDAPSMAKARAHGLGPLWQCLDPLALCTTPPRSTGLTLPLEAPLDPERLLTCLSLLFPHAALPALSNADAKAHPTTQGPLQQEARDDLQQGLKQWTAERRACMPDSCVESVHGVFVSAPASVPTLLDAGARHASLHAAAPTPVEKSAEQASAPCAWLHFVGQGLRPATLSSLLKLCVPYVRRAKPLRDRASLSADELASLSRQAEQEGRPVPDGWWFDGHSYLDGFGTRLYHRPDVEDLAAHFLQHVNAAIEHDNAHIAHNTL